MSPIEENAYRLLNMVCQTKERELDYHALQEQSGLSETNFYEALEFLTEVQLVHDYQGTVELTNKGKRACHEVKNHPAITRTERAIRVVNEQMNELATILETAKQSSNIKLGIQLLNRWDDGTETLLSADIHPNEAIKFDGAIHTVVDVIDTLDRLTDAVESRRAFLVALKHDFANQPDSVFPEEQSSAMRETKPSDPRKVFVVYGRNEKARKAIFAFLRSIGLDPQDWSQWVEATRQGSPYTGEVLKKGFREAQAFVVLMTPDDEARLREPLRTANEDPHEINLTPQPRPNVIYEAGMAMGIAEDRTILIELGRLRPISDFFGRNIIRMDNTPQRRKDLAHRLGTAGCPIDLTGDWLDAGDFDAALEGL